jgi:heterodisulfide reductase subunit C
MIDLVADDSLANQIKEICGENVKKCYQCGKCTASCPLAFAMDVKPNQVMRMAQLGLKEVLQSSTIWICASCASCTARCPLEIRISFVMDALREIALKENIPPKEPNIPLFHKVFFRWIGWLGKLYEFGFIMEYKLRSKQWFNDILMGIKMFINGKLNPIPTSSPNSEEVRKLIEKASQR